MIVHYPSHYTFCRCRRDECGGRDFRHDMKSNGVDMFDILTSNTCHLWNTKLVRGAEIWCQVLGGGMVGWPLV